CCGPGETAAGGEGGAGRENAGAASGQAVCRETLGAAGAACLSSLFRHGGGIIRTGVGRVTTPREPVATLTGRIPARSIAAAKVRAPTSRRVPTTGCRAPSIIFAL